MFTKDQFLKAIQSKIVYDQNMVYSIDQKGREKVVRNFAEVMKHPNRSVKIERMEDYNSDILSYCLKLEDMYEHAGPITCHLFYAKAGAYSFSEHSDPDDVVLYCCEGMKTISMEGHTMGGNPLFTIKEGSRLHIPAGTKHQAINEHEALTLSFGLEKFIEEKVDDELAILSKDN